MEELIEYKQYVEKSIVGFNIPPQFASIKEFAHHISFGKDLDLLRDEKNKGFNAALVIADLDARRLGITQKWHRRLHCAPREVDVYRLILVS